MANTALSCRPRAIYCPAGPAGPAGTMEDWGPATYIRMRGAVVAITTGSLSCAGFWVSESTVMTAWTPLQQQSGRLRVVIGQPGPSAPSPLILDGVLTYAIPALNVAFVTVNPIIVAGTTLAPTILPIASNPQTGQAVATIQPTVGLYLTSLDLSSFGTGVIRNPTSSNFGTTVEVAAQFAGSRSFAVGTPVVRMTDGAIIGMMATLNNSTNFTAIHGRLLSLALAWAGRVPGVLTSSALLGANTRLQLRPALALGVKVVNPALIPSRPIPLPAISLSNTPFSRSELGLPDQPIGVLATGALVLDPVLDTTNVAVFGGTSLVSAATFPIITSPLGIDYVPVSATTVAVGTGLVKGNFPGSYTPLSLGTPGVVDVSSFIDQADGWIDLETIDSSVLLEDLRFSGAPKTGATSEMQEVGVPTGVYVSALGLVAFATVGNGMDPRIALAPGILVEMINEQSQNPSGSIPVRGPRAYAAPFACGDFIPSTVSSITDAPDYRAAPGTPGHALLVLYYKHAASKTLTFQWSGFASSGSGDPVNFQMKLTYFDSAGPGTLLTDPTAGQVTFQYGTMPTAWSGSPWLALTSLGINSTSAGIPARLPISPLPATNDLVYFGLASIGGRTVYVPPPPAPLTGAVETVFHSAACPITEKAISTSAATGTVVVLSSSVGGTSPGYQLVNFRWSRAASPLVVTSINNASIGSADWNNPALANVLAGLGSSATAAAPVSVTATLQTVSLAAGTALDSAGVQAILSTASVMGTGTLAELYASATPTTFSWRPTALTTPLIAPGYTSIVFTTAPTAGRTIQTVGATVRLTNTATPLQLFVLQLAQTNSTALTTQFADPATGSPSCVVIWSNASGAWFMQYRNGYGGSPVGGTAAITTPSAVPISLSYALSGVTPRVNALVVGRPPVAGNAAAYDPIPSTTFTLANADVTIDPAVTTVSYETAVYGQDAARSYAITSGVVDTMAV